MGILGKIIQNIMYMKHMIRVNAAYSRGASTSSIRMINETDPDSWGFSAFSQNEEDGIIDFLTRKIVNPSYDFIEIGAGDGLANNTAWLGLARSYYGIMIDAQINNNAKFVIRTINMGITCLNQYVTPLNINEIFKIKPNKEPDLFSLDIDGNDYHIAKALFENGLRPKIVVVEYNSAYGPENRMTIPYQDGSFNYEKAHSSGLYYGVSVGGWKAFFSKYGYQFVATEKNGINAFFIKSDQFSAEFVNKIESIPFRENRSHQRTYIAMEWEQQFNLIKDMPFFQI